MDSRPNKVRTIHTLHPRVGATFALIPITIGFEICTWLCMALSDSGFLGLGLLGYFCLLGISPVVIFLGGSLLIWCPVVIWTRNKILKTIYINVSLVALLILSGFLVSLLNPGLGVAAMLGTGCIGGGVAIILLTRLWWTPPHERTSTDAVLCQECGYDLRAQRECRCPECGTTFTLSEIVAAHRQMIDM